MTDQHADRRDERRFKRGKHGHKTDGRSVFLLQRLEWERDRRLRADAEKREARSGR